MDNTNIYALSLCAGVGGIDLGLRLVSPRIRTICYVEGEAYTAEILAARMEEGHLDSAPIWTDLRTFDGRPWRGAVDIVTAGFPCQPFSVAGKRRYEADERHLWPFIARIVEECQPSLIFLENVSIRAFIEPWRDLRELGFSLSRPFACTAAELGAGHLRRRVFVLAYRKHRPQNEPGRRSWESGEGSSEHRPISSDAEGEQMGTSRLSRESGFRVDWWACEPGVERMVRRAPDRVDRDRALGNLCIPIVAGYVFARLVEEIKCDAEFRYNNLRRNT